MFLIPLGNGDYLNLSQVLRIEKTSEGCKVTYAVPRQHTDVLVGTFKGEQAAAILGVCERISIGVTAFEDLRRPGARNPLNPTAEAPVLGGDDSGAARTVDPNATAAGQTPPADPNATVAAKTGDLEL